MKTMRSRESEYGQKYLLIENFSCQGGKRELAQDTKIKMSVKKKNQEPLMLYKAGGKGKDLKIKNVAIDCIEF